MQFFFQIQSILALSAASLIYWAPFASAGGCYPTYSSGSKYSIGAWVSASVTTTTPITYTSCSPPGSGSCPASGYKQEGGVTTTEKFNFQCISEYWCSQSGFAPGGTYSSTAWNKESTACTVRKMVMMLLLMWPVLQCCYHQRTIFYSH